MRMTLVIPWTLAQYLDSVGIASSAPRRLPNDPQDMHIRTLSFALAATLVFPMHGAYAGFAVFQPGQHVGEPASGARPAATPVR